ncbi:MULTISPECIES: SDR family oxidoreductase [unclassified Polaromonas]|uniref:dTDP-4-dehydrorhamnose reductase family protein n=1 Tax=unclassified Polaromonas TaxID=2638319 RepID=UPI000F0746C8|nr:MULTISPECIES: SDR family oxidoreductase [unclassified Polaromonas]AYQ27175.1 SDR family NAD(P)-dependent oxidoreductase [Polaromonas sp. SP1]QGJ17980.1 sugar nucleotide-binding protein [Polaromonas sp. Pch-P]
MRVLVLGASGMLGSAVFREFDGHAPHDVWGLVRNEAVLPYFSPAQQLRILTGVDVLDDVALRAAFERVRPDVVINCVGLIKQKEHVEDPLVVLPINAMLPHRLALLCATGNVRLLHVSTDCVFSGRKGMYTEDDLSDAEDLYGKSKYIGEPRDAANVVTLRTSIVGRELNSSRALVDWFLAQQGSVHGFRRSIFSGMTTIELARVMRDVVLPDPSLHGLYHVSSAPISKFDLLKLVAAQYEKTIDVLPDDALVIDRSLDSSRFRQTTSYRAPSWENMVRVMYEAEK